MRVFITANGELYLIPDLKLSDTKSSMLEDVIDAQREYEHCSSQWLDVHVELMNDLLCDNILELVYWAAYVSSDPDRYSESAGGNSSV